MLLALSEAQLMYHGQTVTLTHEKTPRLFFIIIIFLNVDVDKLGKERPKISVKFESDLLKTKDEIAAQSRAILQTFLCWGHTIQSSVNFRNFERAIPSLVKRHHFQIWQFY